MKKLLLRLAVCALSLAMVLPLAACGGRAKDENTITIWAGGQWRGSDLQNLQAFANEYSESNEHGYTLDVIPQEDLEQTLGASMIKNELPEIIIWDRFNTPTYAEDNILLDINDLIERDNIDLSIFNDQAIEELTYNESVYGLPVDLDVWGMFINMDMVNEYNNTASDANKIVIPTDGSWTWDDLLSYAQKLTKKSNNETQVAGYAASSMQEHFFKFFASTGTDFFNSGRTAVNFDNQQTRDVLNFLKKIANAGVGSSGLETDAGFTNMQLAITNKSLYYTDYIDQYRPNLNYAFLPQPKYSVDGVVQAGAQNAGMIGGYGIAFPQPLKRFQTDAWRARLEKAWTVTKDWAVDETWAAAFSEKVGTLPALKSLLDSDMVQNDPVWKSAAMYANQYVIRPAVKGYLQMQTDGFNAFIPNYIRSEATLEQTLKNITDFCNAQF